MNINEVEFANIAIEKLGDKKGDYSKVHPNNDVYVSVNERCLSNCFQNRSVFIHS